MSVKIRLRRTGANNDVSYRVVAVDSRSPREGSFLETLGWYDPKREGINFRMDADRIAYWKARGAQVSNTVASLLRRQLVHGAAPPANTPAAPVAEPEPEVAGSAADAPSEAKQDVATPPA